MAHSYHVNRTHFRRHTADDLDAEAQTPGSLLREWGAKKAHKRETKRRRKAECQQRASERAVGRCAAAQRLSDTT